MDTCNLFFYLSLCLSIYPSIYLSLSLSQYLSYSLSLSLSRSLSISLCLYSLVLFVVVISTCTQEHTERDMQRHILLACA